MDLVGYRLKNIETEEYVERYGGGFFTIPNVPSLITLPNGDQVWAPVVGQEYSGYVLEEWYEQPPPAPAATIPIISDRQFFQQAAIEGIITEAEALAAVKTGDIPVVLQSIVDSISDDAQRFAAQMLLSGATTFERNHPLTEAVGQSLGWTNQQIENFFLSAALL